VPADLDKNILYWLSGDDAFAFGRAGLAFNVRPLTDDLVAGRRAVVDDVERLNPFVMGLLMCAKLSI